MNQSLKIFPKKNNRKEVLKEVTKYFYIKVISKD